MPGAAKPPRTPATLEAILASVTEGVLAVDPRGEVLLANGPALRFLGVPPGTVGEGKPLRDICPVAPLESLVSGILRDGRAAELPDPVPVGDRFLQASGAAFRAGGGASGAVVVLTDVTRVKRLETVRKDFVANVSHELRTPLAAIRGYVETLQDGALGDAGNAERFLKIIEKHVGQLTNLVDDLLQLSRLEATEAPPTRERVALRAVVEQSVATFADAARKKGVSLERLPGGEGVAVQGDAHLLERAVNNLLDNAIKYTHGGGRATVEVRREGGEARLLVSDTGIGIPAQDQPRVFERFYRVDKSRSREMGGTGLGLAIVKHIAQVHGGRVGLTSTPGVGSVFNVWLPALGSGVAAAPRS